MRLLGRSVSAWGTFAAMLTGFTLTVIISWFPDTPGDVAERILPFILAIIIATFASRKH
jgi:sodium/proline symporter